MSILTHALRQAWIALLAAAPVWFAVADVGRVVHRAPLPESMVGLRSFQHRAEPLLANAVLLLAAFLLAMTLPAFVRRGRRKGAPLALLGITLLGLAVLRVARPGAGLITVTSALLVAVLATAAVLTARGRAPRRPRLVAAGMLAALILPHVHRLVLDAAGDPHAGAVAAARDAAVTVVAVAFALSILAAPLHRRDVLAAVPATGVAVLLLARYRETRDVLADTTGLWLTTLPRPALTAAVTLAVFGVVRLMVHALAEKRAFGLAAGLLFCVLAGFLPTRPEEALLAALGACAVALWADGRAETIAELAG